MATGRLTASAVAQRMRESLNLGGNSNDTTITSATSELSVGASAAKDYATVERLPKEAPMLRASMLPNGFNISQNLWQATYAILRDFADDWLDVRVFQAIFLGKEKRPLSIKFLKTHCSVGSLKLLFVNLPYVAVCESKDGGLFVRLSTNPKATKNATLIDGTPYATRRPGGRAARDQYYADLESTWIQVELPEQPEHILPPNVRVPQALRQCVYELLINYFPNGVDVITFAESYATRFGFPLSTKRDCGVPLECALDLMADIVDTGVNKKDGQQWLQAVPYEMVKTLCKPEKAKRRESSSPDLVNGGAPGDEDPEQRLFREVQNEIAALLEPYEEDGIPVESLAIGYGVRFPQRGINRANAEMLKEWIKTMPDVAQVYTEEEDGQEVAYAKLLPHSSSN